MTRTRTRTRTRTCKVCLVLKPIEEFSPRTSGKYLYRLKTCDPCQKEKDRLRARKYTEENREKIRWRTRLDKQIRYEKDPEFREKIKDRSRKASRKYYEENRERILAKRRARRKTGV